MKIAYLPPYKFFSPEYQHFAYFQKVAAQYGCTAEMTLTPEEITAFDPDFVFVFGEYHGRKTDHPHYGLLQSPRDIYIDGPLISPYALETVFTWDGYLTTAKATEGWIGEMVAIRETQLGIKAPRVGHFFVAGDIQDFTEDYGPQKLIYAGGGWDKRGLDMCRRLTELLGDQFEIYGSPDNWTQYEMSAYKGFVNTSAGLLDIYRQGVVLSISNPRYARDDIVTTRMHEASSVGANCITLESATTRMMYGDSLYYYDAADEVAQAEQVAKIYQDILADKAGREARRRAAHNIFNVEHSLTAQFPRLLRYHNYMQHHLKASR